MSKKKVSIVTDASADLPPNLEEKYDITILPVHILFEDERYTTEGIEKGITWEQFYELADKIVPTTAIPSPGVFYNTFQKALEKADSVIAIFISDKLSGVYNTAVSVRNQMLPDEDITIYTSGHTSAGTAAVILKAAEMIEEGKPKEEICKKIEEDLIPNTNYIGIMNTLENMVRTGRMSKTKKFFADFLKFKPICGYVDGEVHVHGKIRANDELIIEQMKKASKKALENMHPDGNLIILTHTRWPEAAEEIVAYMKEVNGSDIEIIIQETGPLNSFFTGKKLLAFGYLGKFDPDWLLETN
jgi:DegV family protein with EDD domain